MPNRHGSPTDGYRYGFNGHESNDEVYGSKGSSYDFGARMYDARIGRFLSTDPWENKYAWQSSYVYFKNSPIGVIDWKGFGGPGDRELNSNINGGAGEKSAAGSSGTGADGRSSVFADVSMTNGNTNNPSKAFPSLIAKEAGISLAQLYKYNSGLNDQTAHEIGQGQQIFTSPLKTNSNAPKPPAAEPTPTSNGNGKINLEITSWVGALGQSVTRTKASTPITATTGFWNYKASAGTGISVGAGIGINVDIMSVATGDITFAEGAAGSDNLAGLLNQGPIHHTIDASAVIKYTYLRAYKNNNGDPPVYTGHLWGGGVATAGLAGSRSKVTFTNTQMTTNDSIIRAQNDKSLPGRGAFLKSKGL